MQSLNSLYFPETVLPHHLRNCLLLLPGSLHFLQAVEKDPTDTKPTTDSDLFMEQAICQVHTPSALGKERDRFLKLIEEISTRKDNFGEQLSNLTLAHLSEVQTRGDHTSQAITSALLDGNVPGDTESDEESHKAALWQARLVLVLAEILDREEAELAASLADIDDTEMLLFQELHGEAEEEENVEDNPLAELMRIKANINQPRPGTVKRRLNAWKTLYASGPLPQDFWLWLSAQEEAAELLIDWYETAAGRNSVPLLRLQLPKQIYMRDDDALKSIRNFQNEVQQIRTDIISKLTGVVSQGHLNIVDPVALLPDAGILSRDWNEQIEYFFPENKYGSQTLDFQFLANISLDQLLRDKGADTQAATTLQHGIVALLRE
jgi:hypothetical protein